MNRGEIRRIGALLQEIGKAIGVPLLWRYPPSLAAVPEELYHHCNPFCRAVKRSAERSGRCNQEESRGLARQVAGTERPFLKRCHAGAVEVVAPITVDELSRGVLIAGPFREEGSCPYAALGQAYAALPLLSRAKRGHLERLLQGLAEQIGQAYRLADLESPAAIARDPRIARVESHLRMHPGEACDLAAMAALCHLSPSRFSHLFRAEVGRSFQQHRIWLRVQSAKELLASTDQPLAGIAAALGFSDQSHFGAVFRAAEGVTPRHYRRRCRGLEG